MYAGSVTKHNKKRNRIQLSCSNCRKKKIKCDRRRPTCTSCEVHGWTDCVYFNDPKTEHKSEDAVFDKEPIISKETSQDVIKHQNEGSWSGRDTKTKRPGINNQVDCLVPRDYHTHEVTRGDCPINYANQKDYEVPSGYDGFTPISRIRQLFKALKVSDMDKISIYRGADPIMYFASRTNNYGPFAWLTIIKKDPFSSPIRESVMIAQKDIITKLQKCTETFKERTVDLHSGYETLKQDSGKLMEQLLRQLPNKKAIWLFIDRFFNCVYPYIPILDQASFIKNVERLINGDHINDLTCEHSVEKLNISQYYDLAIVGTVLIVIKFSYESLLSNTGIFENASARSENDRYLINFQQDKFSMKYINLCLNEFLLSERVPLEVLQCSMLAREYQKINGCDGFADGDSHIYTGLLVRMAISLGLNRDPCHIQKLHSPREALLRRKIWFCLISADNFQYTQTGQPPLIYCSHYDTELPEFDEVVSNVEDLQLEKVSIDFVNTRFLFDLKMRELADLLANMKKVPTIEQVVLGLCNIENELQSRFGSYNDILAKSHFGAHYKKIEKLGQLLIYTYVLTFLQPVYMHIYYHYQHTGQFDACYFFHNKILSFWMFTLGNAETLVKESYKYFGEGFDLLLVGMIEISLHKGLIFFVTTFVKCKLLIENLANSAVVNKQLIDVIEYFKDKVIMKLISTIHIPLLQILSRRFFYSWRLLKGQSFILQNLKDDKLDFSLQKSLYNFLEHLTVSDFKMLIETSKYENYKVGEEQPEWLVEWLNDCNDYKYKRNFCKTIPADDLSAYDGVSLDFLAETIDDSVEDEKWWAKIYEELSGNRNGKLCGDYRKVCEPRLQLESSKIEDSKTDSTRIVATSDGRQIDFLFGNSSMSNYQASDYGDPLAGLENTGLNFDDFFWS